MINAETVIVIDYGIGNTHSVFNAVNYLGYKVKTSSDFKEISQADYLILPGVGAFDQGMRNLHERGLVPVLEQEVLHNKKPILGICLGMQMLASYSLENGHHAGLNWIPGTVTLLELPKPLSVPHVGWNNLKIKAKQPLFSRNVDGTHLYFDHSFHFECDSQYVAATCDYGREVVAAVKSNNIFGVQFHPEKSQTNGLRLLKGFLTHGSKTC